MHGGHIRNIDMSLGVYKQILMTLATRDLLIAIKGDWLRFRKNLKPLSYRTVFEYHDEHVTLYPARHILGSAQILVEDVEGTRIVYSGDFLIPNTTPVKADVLVVDATYGDPCNIRRYNRDTAIEHLILLTKKLLKRTPVNILASKGKLQEVMNLLFEGEVEEPFLLPTTIFRMAQVYEKYGIKMGNYIHMEEEEAKELLRREQPYVAFYTIGSKMQRYPKIKVSGYITNWKSTNPVYEVSKDYWVVTLSDHADFNGTLEYIRESRPELVITDNCRCFGNAILLAQEIKKKSNIDAIPMPS